MRKIREVLRLAFGVGLALRKIECSMGISHATASSCVARARAADLSWPLPESLDDTALDRLLFPKPAPSGDVRPLPDWAYVHLELRRKSVTKLSKLSAKRKNNIMVPVKCLFNDAKRRGDIRENPCEMIRRFKEERPITDPLSFPE